MGSRVGRPSEVNLALQAGMLCRVVPDSTIRLRPGRLTWFGWVQPTVETARYRLRIEARQQGTPTVRVLAPTLKPNNDGLLPHVYDTGSLCVSRPGEWNAMMFIVDTILPWTCEWLAYYELWLTTGLWCGDGPDRLDTAWQASILHPYG